MSKVPVEEISAATKSELFCTYAALALYDGEAEMSAESISAMISKAGGSVEAYWPTMFAKILEKQGAENVHFVLEFIKFCLQQNHV